MSVTNGAGARMAAAAVMGLLASAGQAQTSAPTQSLPSREQIQPNAGPGTPPSRVRVERGQTMAPGPCPFIDSPLTISVTKLNFSGVGGRTLPNELKPLLSLIKAPGTNVSIKTICDVRDEANALLRRTGYLALAQIPPQRIDDGVLQLEVITARIIEVRVRGDAGPYRSTLLPRIEALKALDPLREQDAEQVLLLAGDVPGLDVQLTLRTAGTEPGDVIGELTVKTRRSDLVANYQNLGSKQIGRGAVYSRASVYGLTGASQTFVGASTTLDWDEQQIAQFGHVQTIGASGATLSTSFVYAWSRPDLGLLDLRSRSWVANFEVAYPFIRSLRRNLSLTGGLEIIDQRTKVFQGAAGASPLNLDQIRVAYARLDGGWRALDTNGSERLRVNADLEVRRGLSILGATKLGSFSGGYSPSRFEGDPEAFLVRGSLDTLVPLTPVFSLAGLARGQWANHPLLNFEEFAIGNMTVGRGYDPGANSADRAIAVRGEGRAKLYDRDGARAEFYAFYDWVRIYNLDNNAIENRRNLASFGGGLRVSLNGRSAFDLAYARPRNLALLVPGAAKASDRFLLSITHSFGPSD
jgi:hemolysin activation/secretion protein